MSPDRDPLLMPEANRRMFDGIAGRYDLLNRLLTLGLDQRWRRRAVAALEPRAGGRYLDVGCGTGDVCVEVLRQAAGAMVVGVDPAARMLARAVERVRRQTEPATFIRGDATALPFADGAFDGIASAFTLRNFADRAAALGEMRRVLAPGGRLAMVETSVPCNPVLRLGHWLHMHTAVPLLGWLLAGDARAYGYLTASTEALPPPSSIVADLGEAGFRDTSARSLTGGVVTLYTAMAC